MNPRSNAATVAAEEPAEEILHLVAAIEGSRDFLVAQHDLTPANKVLSLHLHELVAYATKVETTASHVGALDMLRRGGVIAAIRQVCQHAEAMLELHYAAHVTSDSASSRYGVSARERLLSFPYIDHYFDLALAERDAAGVGPGRTIVFLGGGALPLSAVALVYLELLERMGLLDELRAILLLSGRSDRITALRTLLMTVPVCADPHGTKVRVVERSSTVCSRARAVVRALGLDPQISVHEGDAESFIDFGGCELVIVASMLEFKDRVVQSLSRASSLEPRARVILRGVEPDTLKELFYEPLTDPVLQRALRAGGLEYRDTVLPPLRSSRLNSIEVFAKA